MRWYLKLLVLIVMLFSVSCQSFKERVEKSLGPVITKFRNSSYDSYLKHKYAYIDKANAPINPHLTEKQRKKSRLKAAINNSVAGAFIAPPTIQGHVDYKNDKRFNTLEKETLIKYQREYEWEARNKFKH